MSSKQTVKAAKPLPVIGTAIRKAILAYGDAKYKHALAEEFGTTIAATGAKTVLDKAEASLYRRIASLEADVKQRDALVRTFAALGRGPASENP